MPNLEACRILVPQPGIELMPPAVETSSLNHWTTREFPQFGISPEKGLGWRFKILDIIGRKMVFEEVKIEKDKRTTLLVGHSGVKNYWLCPFLAFKMSKQGVKFWISLGLPAGAMINCADNTGAKNLYIISVKAISEWLNRLPAAGVGDMVMATIKKGKSELRKNIHPVMVIWQWNSYWEKMLCFFILKIMQGSE